MVKRTRAQGSALKPAKGLGPLDPVYKRILLAVLLIVVFASAARGAEQVSAFTDNMLKHFDERFTDYYEPKIWKAALSLFGLLFLCQFTWSVAQLCLQESLSFTSVIVVVVRQVMTGMFFYWLLFDRSILRGIVGSFSQLAGSGMKFSDMLVLMEIAVQNIMAAVGKSSGVIEGFALFFTGLSASIVMSFALTTAIAYMAVVMLENYIVGSLGLILLGFGGSDYTRNYALSYIRTLVHIGIKLFLSTVIVQVGVTAFTKATFGLNDMSSTSVSQACMRLIAQSFFFLAVVKVIPEIANSLVSGSSTTGAHTVHGIRSAGTAAGAAIAGVATGAYKTPGAVADTYNKNRDAVKHAVNAFSSKYEKSRSGGHNPLRAGISALGGALWGAYMEGSGATKNKAQVGGNGQSPWANTIDKGDKNESPTPTPPQDANLL